jgi:polysaccharide export outer membrane protein
MLRSRAVAFVLAAALAGLAPAEAAQGGRDKPSTPGRPPAAAIPPAGAQVSAPDGADYRLGAGDKLRIEVYKDPQLSQSVQIRPDGKITMPLIGDLAAVDMTPIELRDRIAAALKDYVTNPVVTVIVVEAVASSVYVMGEINRPGPVPLQGPLTALQALAMAGGFKDFANTKDIRILRRNRTGVETIRFNYREAVRGNGAPIYLRAGDTIIVP